ncbi:FAST kinase domain-containing protein 3 [Folsomia candida]|uniref:FAST kinase domain-containing protein 3 n=1 Tax=Folsomia candida TaxID=158441 RepID=A0A226EI51_FOLCA|nr:FAST kinase domain-containing protein 3 [Folsomia candida]
MTSPVATRTNIIIIKIPSTIKGNLHKIFQTFTPPLFFSPVRLSPNVVSQYRGPGLVRSFSSWGPVKLDMKLRSVVVRHHSSDRELGETSTMHQEGGEIQEVPLAVLKTKSSDCFETEEVLDLGNGKADRKNYIDLDAREEAAFVEGFNNFNSPQQILKMLETVPTQEVTPFVSLGILKKLFQLENNFVYRNDGLPWTVSSENGVMDTFTRTAIVNRLVDTIQSTDDPTILLGALDAFKCEIPIENSSGYRDKLLEEILRRVTKGQFQLTQVCEAIITLGKIERDTGKPPLQSSLIDKLWIGIFEKSEDINENNITLIFQVLPHFKKSQRLVLNLAERKILTLWWKIETEVVAKICETLITTDKTSSIVVKSGTEVGVGVSNRVLSALSRCINLNIHHVTEAQLYTIVKAFQAQNFCDTTFVKALNKYMKARGLKITDPKVVAAVLVFSKKFHIRSESILEAAAEFLVLHKAANITPPDLTSIVTAFGHLDFQPSNGVRFWQTVETYLDDKFIQFSPKDIIDVLLSCCYLSKFPLNFADRVFSPYFLDRVHTCEQDYNHLQLLRSKLKLLDISISIECSSKYGGPMLPRDFTSRSVFIDGRILRMGNWLEEVVKEVLGVRCSVEKFIVLPNLPLNAFYIADILVANVRRFESERTLFSRWTTPNRLRSYETTAFKITRI